MKNICFYYPSSILGGAELLFARAANALLRTGNYKVAVLDRPGGTITKYVESEIDIISENGEDRTFIDCDIFITTPTLLYQLYHRVLLKPGSHVVMWVIQPNNMIPIFPFLKELQHQSKIFRKLLINTFMIFETNKRSKLLDYLVANKSIYFMDRACFLRTSDYLNRKIESNDRYLPVFITNYSKRVVKKVNHSNINVVWLGRIDNSFKIKVLLWLLNDLDSYSLKCFRKIHFHIIGNGDGFVQAELMSRKMRNIKVTLLGEIENHELDKILSQYDVAFAMGTSALETAACNVPTVCLDASYTDITRYRYRWLSQGCEFTLGYVLEKNVIPEENKLDIASIFEVISRDRDSILETQMNYLLSNHSERVFIDRFNRLIVGATSSYEELIKHRLIAPSFLKVIWDTIKYRVLR